MKSKYNLNVLLIFLFFILVLPASWSAVKVDVQENSITAKTDRHGVEGFQGESSMELRSVPAYIFRLYKLENLASVKDECDEKGDDKGDAKRTRGNNSFYQWILVEEKTSIDNEVIFEEYSKGEFKVIVLNGEIKQGQKLEKNNPKPIIQYNQEEANFTIGKPIIEDDKKHLNKYNTDSEILFKIFPNPTTELITIQASGELKNYSDKGYSIEIHDYLGRFVKELKYPNITSQPITIGVKGMPSGTYFVKITAQQKLLHQDKIIVINKK